MHERTLVVSKITAANSTQASATADTTTTSATDVLVNSMTITPGAGDYHIWFSGSVSCSASDSTQNVSLYVNGIQVAHTERQIFSEGSIVGSSFPVATHAYVAGVGASQAIEVRWRTTAATATMHERTLVVEKVSTTAAATWATSQEDTKLTGYFKSGPVRLRFEVSNEGGESSGGVTYELQVAQASTCSSGSYNPVPTDTSGHWQIVGSAYITDGESTSNIDPGLTDEAATFVAGQLKDTGNTTGSITLNANEFTEIEFAIQATTNATDGANYCFCLYNATKTITYTKYAEATILAPTAVLLSSFEATAFDEAVLLEWRTGYEVSNLGFNIYREEGGQLYQLTSEPIKGSALMTGAGTRTAGYSYTWWDISAIADVRGSRYVLPPSSKLSALRYYLEDLDLNGTKTMHGPVTPVFSHNPAPQKAQSMLLSQINRQGAEGRAQDLREKLKEKNVNRYTLLGKTNNDSRITNNEASSLASRPKAGPRANISVSSMDDRNETPAGRMVSARLSDKPLKGASEVQQALAARPSVKIFIQEEGWYRVTQSELVAAGLDPAVNPRFLQLFVDGQEQPILVKGGKNDRLGSRGSIEFYGTGLDTPYTDTRVYWLVPGSKPGKRIDSHIFNPLFRNPHSAIRNSFESFPYTVEKKDRTIYVAALKNGEASNFFGSVVSSTPVDQVLKVPHLDSFAPRDALLEVSLQGVSAGAHQVMVMVNGVVVGTMAFEGQTLKVERFPLVQAGLVEGENVVTLAGQGVPLDVSLVDSIRLTYWRTYTADEDILKFTAVGGNNLSVNGFSSSSIRVMDITDLQNLKEVGGAVQGEGGGYSFRFRVPGEGKRTLLAFVDEEARTPAALELNQPSRWHHSRQEADLVIISHGDFLESLKPLKAWRESQGLSVALIDVEDLYDEFSFGIKTPEALKDFLLRAKTSWQKAPRFVLLVGDASFDPRNYYGFGHFDYVPTKLVDTAYIETASDDWFVDFDNDGIPDMAIGRIPVRTEEEAAGIVSKLIGYEQSRERMQDVLLVADLKDNDFDYMAASQGVKALLPGGLMVSEVYRDQFSDDVQVKNELVRRLNQGPLLVNYIGHGTLEFWRGDIFGSDDAEILTNGLRLPFVIGMTCLNGFFQDVYYETLAEAFLKASNGGAVAVWTSSGLTEPDKQAVMNKEMIRLLFNGEGLTIGEAVKRAKASTSDQDIRRTWILFGDPATRLKP
jgi:hypothetical protein